MLKRFEKCFCSQNEYKHVENKGSYFTERDGAKLTIYFEKSNGLVDWLNNFDFTPECTTPTKPIPTKVKGVWRLVIRWLKALIFSFYIPKKAYKDMSDRWYCHGGFLKVWKSIEPYLVDQINNPMIKEFEVIGYSHGGAIAQLCFEYIKYWRPDAKATGYGFGAPRVFYGTPSAAVRKRFQGFTVIRNGKDIVTHLPPQAFGFKHIGSMLEMTVGASKGLIKDHYPDSYWAALYAIEKEETAG